MLTGLPSWSECIEKKILISDKSQTPQNEKKPQAF
jgi:hypothetical protein